MNQIRIEVIYRLDPKGSYQVHIFLENNPTIRHIKHFKKYFPAMMYAKAALESARIEELQANLEALQKL